MKVIFSDLDGTYYLMRHIANKPIINTFEWLNLFIAPHTLALNWIHVGQTKERYLTTA